jgi:hypothetical protein
MPISSSAIDATESALLSAGKPWIASELAIDRDAASPVKWTSTGDHGDSDEADADYPTARAIDGHLHLDTRPDSSATTWYLTGQLTSAAAEVDTLIIRGDFSGGLPTVTLTLSTDAAFTSPTTATTVINVVDGRTVVALTDRYTGASYARLQITDGSAITPQIHEWFVGRRRQLPAFPERPGEMAALRWDGGTFRSASGIEITYAEAAGFVAASWDVIVPESYAAGLRAMRAAANYGARPIWMRWDAEDPYLFRCQSPIEIVQVQPLLHSLRLDVREVAPFVSSEDA